MSAYQLYKKEYVSVALDVDSRSFLTEKYQLVKQGFERIGDQVIAKDKQEALGHLNQTTLDSLYDFAMAHLVQTCVTVITAIVIAVRFI